MPIVFMERFHTKIAAQTAGLLAMTKTYIMIFFVLFFPQHDVNGGGFERGGNDRTFTYT